MGWAMRKPSESDGKAIGYRRREHGQARLERVLVGVGVRHSPPIDVLIVNVGGIHGRGAAQGIVDVDDRPVGAAQGAGSLFVCWNVRRCPARR